MRHELKCWPIPFRAVRSGMKTHEIRTRQDHEARFNTGDTLLLREWDPALNGNYTGEHETVAVTYVTPGGEWGLPPDLFVLSIARVGAAK